MNKEENDYEYEEENLSFGDSLEIILLEPFNGKNIGDIIEVYRGMYDSLIDMGKGLPVNCWEENLTDSQRLVINAKNLEKTNEELEKTNLKLHEELAKLKEKQLRYNNKMMENTDYKQK